MLSPEAIIGLVALLVASFNTFWGLWKSFGSRSTKRLRNRDNNGLAMTDFGMNRSQEPGGFFFEGIPRLVKRGADDELSKDEETGIVAPGSRPALTNRWHNHHAQGPINFENPGEIPSPPSLQFGATTTVSWTVLQSR